MLHHPRPRERSRWKNVKPDPVFSETIPPIQRVSREALVKAANSYFDAIEKGDAAVSSFDPLCNRLEERRAGCVRRTDQQ